MKILFDDKYFLCSLVLIGACLYFFNLDNYHLGLDQGDYLLHGVHILQYGVPYIGGEEPPYFDDRFAIDGVWAYHPWLGMYLIAGSIALFGQTTLGGVFPSAMSGLASIIATYYLARLVYKNIHVARLSAIFFTFSVPYILYFRTSRYFGSTILLGILTLIFFIRLWKFDQERVYLFCISSILLFYSMYSQFFGLFTGFTLFSVVAVRNRAFYRKLAIAYGVIACFTLPWFLKYFLPVNMRIKEYYSDYFNRDYDKNAGTVIEFVVGFLGHVNSHIFPFILLVAAWSLKRFFRFGIDWDKYKLLLSFCILCSVLVATLHTIPLFNYILGTVSIWTIFLAEITYKLFKVNFAVGGLTATVLLFTNWLHIFPWFFYDKVIFPGKAGWVASSSSLLRRWDASIRGNNLPRYFFLEYLEELGGKYNGALREIAGYLNEHGRTEDTFVIAHEGDSLSYYTGMTWGNVFPFKEPPKWIIPRTNRPFSPRGKQSSREEKQRTNDYVMNYLKSHPYRKITLSSCDSGFENTYNISNHRFGGCIDQSPKTVIYEYTGTDAGH